MWQIGNMCITDVAFRVVTHLNCLKWKTAAPCYAFCSVGWNCLALEAPHLGCRYSTNENRSLFTRYTIYLQRLTGKKFTREVKRIAKTKVNRLNDMSSDLRFLCHSAWTHRFSQNVGPQTARPQKSYMKQGQYWGLINIRRHRTKFRRHGDLAPTFLASFPCCICELYKYMYMLLVLHGARVWCLP